jgi:hypothetical protein
MIASTPTHLSAGALVAVALLSGLGASGCAKFASDLDTPTDSPGVQTLELDPGDWSCVSDEAGPVMNPNGPPLDFPVDVRDYFTGAPPMNLRVRACFRPDVACIQPATDWLTPDETGMVTLPLTEGFSGYLEITGEDEIPTLYVLPAALTPELVQALQSVTISLLSLDALLAFGEVSQLELDPGAGVLSMNTFDCTGSIAPGVRLELNAAAVPFAFIRGLPEAGEDTTTDDGAAGFANVLPGLVVVRGFRAGTTDLLGLETVLVRAGWVSISNLMPQFAGTP